MLLEGTFLAFLILKLLGVITWSWWLVFMPMYFWLFLVLGIAIGQRQ